MSLRLQTLVVATAAALSLAACVVVPARPYARPHYVTEVVTVAPPPPQVEHYGPPPVVGYVWLGGFWSWRANRHVWIDGHWEAPRPGHHWEPHAWVREGDGWRLREGRWEQR